MKEVTLLLPLITIILTFIIIIAVMKNKSSGNRAGNPYHMNQGYRMLCKSQSNRAIAGVCGGIAEYFGWNATIVRLIFLFSGVGLLAYIILTIAIPNSDSTLP